MSLNWENWALFALTGSNAGLISLLKNHPKAESVVVPPNYSPREHSINVRLRF
jgi:hypothetical protein